MNINLDKHLIHTLVDQIAEDPNRLSVKAPLLAVEDSLGDTLELQLTVTRDPDDFLIKEDNNAPSNN